ncbi:hypothetical protein F2P56_008448 [Juglans regia]|uniref:Uncharacterized protein LOC109006738 n=2 Tax=Juglans regia TaxID=51240 RepID=A0A2I4GCS5_JUGRE|nr:uncharacterized protein LOC109006738 [Juglans regia]KAF5471675.1 hypothetical protein F2P56_008448 [Juglans regia]
MQFLMGLSDSFNNLRSQILLIGPFPSINKVIALVLQEEKQKEVLTDSTPNLESIAALLTKQAPNLESIVALMAKSGKPGNSSFKQSGFRKDRPMCSHCGDTGHTSDKCYKIHGFLPGFKSKRATTHSKNQTSSSAAGQERNEIPQLTFTQEQCQQLLAILKPSTSTPHSGNQITSLQKSQVLHLSQLLFFQLHYLLLVRVSQDLSTWTTIGMGEEIAGPYHFLQQPLVGSSIASSSVHQDFDLWHYRLGHISYSR